MKVAFLVGRENRAVHSDLTKFHLFGLCLWIELADDIIEWFLLCTTGFPHRSESMRRTIDDVEKNIFCYTLKWLLISHRLFIALLSLIFNASRDERDQSVHFFFYRWKIKTNKSSRFVSRRSFLCWRWKSKIFLHCSTNNRLRWNGRIIVVTIISRHEKHSSHDKCRPLLRRFHIFSPPSLTRDSSGAMVDIIQSYFSWEFLIPSP